MAKTGVAADRSYELLVLASNLLVSFWKVQGLLDGNLICEFVEPRILPLVLQILKHGTMLLPKGTCCYWVVRADCLCIAHIILFR